MKAGHGVLNDEAREEDKKFKREQKIRDAAPELLEAVKACKAFWDDMPKGQMGKLTFDVGLFNEMFVTMSHALKKVEE